MSQAIEFYYDFGSPNAYMVHKLLPGIAKRHGAQLIYRPMLLGGVFKLTGNVSPALAGVRGKMDYLQREMRRFVLRHHVPFTWNPHFPIMSIHLMRGAVHAQGKSWEAAYIDAMFKACWVSGDNMSDPDVIKLEMAKEDLPAVDISLQMRAPEVKAALFAATEAAVERGIFGAPTMFRGGEMYFGKESLTDLAQDLSDQA